ncbi:MAG: glycosyltransferase [Bacteroidetes bacterium]|nr:glycosyltransferase [Bacteroidota bacterium]
MTSLLIILLSSYLIMLVLLIWGFTRATQRPEPVRGVAPGLSVIVPCRNEEANLPSLIESLLRQQFPADQMEIILVDDHSEDNTLQLMESFSESYPRIRAIPLPDKLAGKKAALEEGIRTSKFSVIVTTDADCIHENGWLAAIGRLMTQPDTNMVVGMVRVASSSSNFPRLQSLEFASLTGSAIAALGWGRPLMCNGASLAFRKEVFEKVGGYEGDRHLASGDDEFLMRKVTALNHGTIVPMTNSGTVAETRPQATWSLFVQQRIRWASKWKHNHDPVARTTALLVAGAHLAFLASIVVLLIHPVSILMYWTGGKILAEGYFFRMVSKRLAQPFDLISFLMWQLIYPFYVLIIGAASLTLSWNWKGRNYAQ